MQSHAQMCVVDFFSVTITLQTIMTAWLPGTMERGGKLKYIHFCLCCKKNTRGKQTKGRSTNQKTDLPRGRRLCTQTPDLGLSSLLVGSPYRLQILFVLFANTFCIVCNFLHCPQILIVSSVNTFTFYKYFFSQRLQIPKLLSIMSNYQFWSLFIDL